MVKINDYINVVCSFYSVNRNVNLRKEADMSKEMLLKDKRDIAYMNCIKYNIYKEVALDYCDALICCNDVIKVSSQDS